MINYGIDYFLIRESFTCCQEFRKFIEYGKHCARTGIINSRPGAPVPFLHTTVKVLPRVNPVECRKKSRGDIAGITAGRQKKLADNCFFILMTGKHRCQADGEITAGIAVGYRKYIYRIE